MRTPKRPIALAMTVGIAGVLSGCHSIPLANKLPILDSAPAVPKRMAAMWTETVLTHVGKPATRGLGGRFFFYDRRQDPIEVSGKLVVYAYDDSLSEDADRPADRRYVFDAELIDTHLRRTELGPCYDFWIPWDPVGGEQKELSLVAVFTSSTGELLVGEHSRHILPGKKPKRAQISSKPAPRPYPVQSVGFNRPSDTIQRDQAQATARRVSTKATTIPIPPAVSGRLRRAAKHASPEVTVRRAQPSATRRYRPRWQPTRNWADNRFANPRASRMNRLNQKKENPREMGSQPANRSAQSQFQALGAPYSMPNDGHDRRQRSLGGSHYVHSSQPGWDRSELEPRPQGVQVAR